MSAEWIQAVGSVLAILAAAVAIFLQSRELREQQKELAAQRRELELQRRQLELQREELARNVSVQQRIADTANYQGYLDLQLRLLILMFQHAELPAVFGLSEANDERRDWMRHVYITAWMRLMQSGFALGQMAEATVETELRETFLANELGVAWWRQVEHIWRSEAAHVAPGADAGRRRAFVDLVERVCNDAEDHLADVHPQ